MRNGEIRTPADALVYITDCQLATVARMAGKKSRPKGEFDRQVKIAQTCCDAVQRFNLEDKGNRFEDVAKCGNSVAAWATKFEG